ncbi:MAG: hypothetical protein KC912_07720 [Proteobacteria bacterium]|nr:hypothetical protein [Pseudomonadota bacterium]
MSIEEALLAAGETGAAAIWRTSRRDLAGPLRLLVLARDAAVARRLADDLEDATWLIDARQVTEVSLGLLDDLLSVHAVIWATPAHAPLPSAERELLDALTTAPEHRSVVLADRDLLARISDDPATEAEEIRARIAKLLPENWPLDASLTPNDELRAQRTQQVAGTLIDGALAKLDQQADSVRTELAQVATLTEKEDEALERARRDAARVAAHVLAAMRRHTEQLLIDVRDLLVRVEQDLPAQLHDVDDLDLARRALPHWLQHVIDTALDQGLSTWRVAVLADLAELEVDAETTDQAELLLPTLHPPPFTRETGWGRRLAMTAALGGAALLAAAGLWVPTLLAVGSGFAWSTWAGDKDEADTRDALIDGASEALRGMGRDAERVLNEQIEAMAAEQAELQDERTEAAARSQDAFRAELEVAHARLVAQHAHLDSTVKRLKELA